jgi:hypothetical protein
LAVGADDAVLQALGDAERPERGIYTLAGTHRGPFAGVPATGKRVTPSGIAIFRLAGGRIAEGRGCADSYGLLRQLGALPGPAQSGGSGGHS